MEKKLGLPVTAFMDGLTDPKTSAKTFLGFLDFVVLPLVTPLINLYPSLEHARKQLEENRAEAAEICSVTKTGS